MCEEAPSLTEQYEYAHERGIKWLVIITEAALSLTESVKVKLVPLMLFLWIQIILAHFSCWQ